LGAHPQRVTITGNTKSDTLVVATPEEKQKRRRGIVGDFDGLVLVGGSTWGGEEKALLKLFEAKIPQTFRLVLAPRRPERFQEVEHLLKLTPHTWTKWSQIKGHKIWETDILLLDTLGDLRRIYEAADIAFIGGSLYPRGGQNPLEAAAARLPLLFGPFMDNFSQEAHDFRKRGAAHQVLHAQDLVEECAHLMKDGSLRLAMGEAAVDVVVSYQGAADRTLEGIRDLLLL
jgi:3-deoxy-D-manno-octulosonic-acid transferase